MEQLLELKQETHLKQKTIAETDIEQKRLDIELQENDALFNRQVQFLIID